MPTTFYSPRLRHALHTLCASLLAWLILSGMPAAGACGPEPGGPPGACAGAVAGVGASGGPDAGAGNPINVITGNKYQREEDLPALPGVLGLEIVRHYNSAYSKPGSPNGPLGREWKLSYETELIDKFGRIQILQADGARVIFDRDRRHPGLCSTALPAHGRLTLAPQANGASDYTWTLPDGRRLHFNTLGKLDTITAATGETLRLLYDDSHLLVQVTDPQGRSLHLRYLARTSAGARAGTQFRGVQHIDSPVGRFSYDYGDAPPPGALPFEQRILLANLLRVHLPAGDKALSSVSRRYHHEDPRLPWLLTGISIETSSASGPPVATRYATFGYDSNGRANLSTHAGNVGKVTLDTSEGGKTVLTNSLGQRTVYRHAIVGGQQRLLEVRGAGCSSCGATNVRYAYDKLGQLLETTRLDDKGEPVSTNWRELDQLGRTVRAGSVTYQHGKRGAAQWRLRLEYTGDDPAPTLIARPSVVPGKERQTRIEYNAMGQVLRVTQTGWVPGYDGMQATAAIARTTSYQYAIIAGHSLLTRIDGPLPNGKMGTPLDSDVTVFEYGNGPNDATKTKAEGRQEKLKQYDESDGRRLGLLTRVIAPGNLVTEVLERDKALRPGKLRVTDGDLIQLATVRGNWRGLPEDIELTAGAMRRHLHYDYDAASHLHTVTRPGKLRSTFKYDQAGRVSRIILPDGSGIALDHDTEDRTASVARYDNMAPVAAESLSSIALSSTRFNYDRDVDKPSRLTVMADTLGMLGRYRYNDIGQVIAIANAVGTSAAFEYDADGRLASSTDAAGSADAATRRVAYDTSDQAINLTAPNGMPTLRRYDDFGRKVFEADPDRGVTLLRYDAADRPLVRIDETRAATRYRYDNAGRLLAVGKDKIANLLQYRYRGSRLAGMLSTSDGDPAHATERLEYQYDAMGQMTTETRWLADVGMRNDAATSTASKGLLFVTRYEYDTAGRLIRQILPDGHNLQYRFTPVDGARQRADKRHRPGQLEAILFDGRIIVSNIEQSIVGGLTGYTMGNGARQQIRLDRRGRIEQLRTLPGDAGADATWWHGLTAWFASSADSGKKPLYRQINQYDEAGRLVQIEWQLATPNGRTPAKARRESYVYDRMDRLTGIVSNNGADATFRYDAAGNRLAESNATAHASAQLTAAQMDGTGSREFHYANNSNWLLAATQSSDDPAAMARQLRDAWFYHPTGVPLAQLQWQGSNSASNRRTVYNSDKRPVAVYDNDRLVARYHYNSLGERSAKTVYPARPGLLQVSNAKVALPGKTTYSLYRDQRLAAETDSRGRISTHYVYLYGKPVAKIEMTENTTFMHRLLKAITMRSEDAPSDRLPYIYAIITNHLGTPQQVVDEQRQLVWQALTAPFGLARVTFTENGRNGKPFEMNLRLPGQVYDAETGLHYNYLRDYDPMLGRYLTPDPMDLGAGTNPYAYVSNNPLSNIDPLGLFQSDIHYYMTFFLAVAAGVNPDEARVIALATQYIDDNPETKPLNLSTGVSDAHRMRLLTYHFTMVPSNINLATGLVMGGVTTYGTPPANSAYGNFPENPQLVHLSAAVTVAGYGHDLSNKRCTQLQLFGEYLHAFEDTFSHRDSHDMPFALNVGLGHGGYGSNPDYTFNHTSWIPGSGHYNWNTNEDRTLQAEKEVLAKLAAWGDSSKALSFDKIEDILKAFNAIHETEAGGETTEERQKGYATKIDLLQSALNAMGYKGIDITRAGAQSFDETDASNNRNTYLRDNKNNPLNQELYQGTILPK